VNTSRTYAPVAWTVGDVQSLAPRLTDQQAEDFLMNNARHIQERLVELGWDVLAALMVMDGIDMTNDEDQP